MALEYTLELATELEAPDVLRSLSSLRLGFETHSERLVAPGVTVTAASETNLGREIIKEAYDLEPTIYVKFRLDKFEAWETGLRTTVQAALELLRKIGADGILIFNGETPVLISKGGTITLNNSYDFWEQPSLLTLVNAPYEMRVIASL